MSAVNFPNTPTPGSTWIDPSNNVKYTWDGLKWTSVGIGVSFEDVIFTFNNDEPNPADGNITDAINNTLIAKGIITSVSDVRSGNTCIILDSGNPDSNPNLTSGQYRYDGTIWIPIAGGGGGQVASVFGRIGNITAQKGDYNIGKLSDVDTVNTPPTANTNSLLRFNGLNWIPGEARNTVDPQAPLVNVGDSVVVELVFDIESLPILP